MNRIQSKDQLSAKRHLQDVLKMSYQDKQDILQMPKRCLKRKSVSHLRKRSRRYLCKIYCRCLTEDALKMSY